MRLILIRHGASIHSLRGMIASGSSCPGLTDNGFKQAHLLATYLVSRPDVSGYHALLSSPASRAYQTAEVLASSLGNRPIIQDNDLTEIRTGDAEGLTWDAYRSQYGAFDLPAEPTRPFAPNGENWLQFTDRVRTALQGWSDMYPDQTVLAVTHAGFIVASMLVIFDIPPTNRGWLEPTYTSLTEWKTTPERWTLVRYNDVSHLA